MTINDFKRRAENQYQKIGVKNFSEFADYIGYSKLNGARQFYRTVPRRAERSLELIELMPYNTRGIKYKKTD